MTKCTWLVMPFLADSHRTIVSPLQCNFQRLVVSDWQVKAVSCSYPCHHTGKMALLWILYFERFHFSFFFLCLFHFSRSDWTLDFYRKWNKNNTDFWCVLWIVIAFTFSIITVAMRSHNTIPNSNRNITSFPKIWSDILFPFRWFANTTVWNFCVYITFSFQFFHRLILSLLHAFTCFRTKQLRRSRCHSMLLLFTCHNI